MSVKFKDYYEILGAQRSATHEEIRKAYHKLARKFHPDVNKAAGAEERFKEISEAYDVIGDPEKRKKYDELGANWKNGQDFTPPPGWGGGQAWQQAGGGPRYSYRTTRGSNQDFNAEDLGGFSDFFEQIFGGGMGGGGRHGAGFGQSFQSRGQDQEAELEVTLEEVFRGAKKRIALQVTEADARGRVQQKVKQLDVTIPPGVTDGARIRLADQGAPGEGGGPAGHLYLRIHLLPHPVYEVDGHDLETLLALTPWEAALGAKVPLTLLDGKTVMLTIPPGTSSDKQLRLAGKGLPRQGHKNGDLRVTIRIEVPARLSAKEKELFEALAKASTFNPR